MQSRPQVERWSYSLWPVLLNPVSKAGSPATAEARTHLLGIHARWARPVPIYSPIAALANTTATLANISAFWSINRHWSMNTYFHQRWKNLAIKFWSHKRWRLNGLFQGLLLCASALILFPSFKFLAVFQWLFAVFLLGLAAQYLLCRESPH
jgi:hypothetical protein